MPALALLLRRWNSLPRAVRVVASAAASVAAVLSIDGGVFSPTRLASRFLPHRCTQNS